MVRITTSIDVGDFTFDFHSEIEINSSWENFTDTARIVIPKKIPKVNADGENAVPAIFTGSDAIFKRKDRVKIYMGYDGVMPLRFSGVITRVDPNIPITIYCEDDMYLLKQTKVENFTLPAPKIADILERILPIDPVTGKKYKYFAEDITIGKFQITGRPSVIETLDYIKRTIGLTVYFRDGELYVGFKYQTSNFPNLVESEIPVFHFQKNVIESGNLEYFNSDDVSYRVTVINIKSSNNTRTKIEVGDVDGEERTLHFVDADPNQLTSLANEELNKWKFTGYRGSFVTFLDPQVRHGDVIRLQDDIIADRNGYYLVKEVQTTSGLEGGRQTITLDRAIQIG